jgi:hypothetical protein
VYSGAIPLRHAWLDATETRASIALAPEEEYIVAQSVVRLPLTSTTPPRTRSRGRPKGRLNNATLEVRAFFRAFFESPRYRENLKRRVLAGEANHMEILGHYYAYGKPKSTMVAEPTQETPLATALQALPKEQLLEMYELARRLREVAAGKAPLPVARRVLAAKVLPAAGSNGKG